MIPKIGPISKISPHLLAFIWIIIVAISLAFFFIFTKMSYFKVDALVIWICSCLILIYQSRKEVTHLTPRDRYCVILLGAGLIILSFVNIPLGFGNPPYSIGDFSILLSGIGLVIIGLNNIRSYVIAIAVPAIAVIGFQIYDLFLVHEQTLSAPLLPFTVFFSNALIQFLGIPVMSRSDLMIISSTTGDKISLLITPECTGIWSLGTFAIIVLMVLLSFPEAMTKKGFLLIAIGFIGTYVGNILRIGAIAMSGYLYGPTGAIENTHLHFGWIIFLCWMTVFWYYFFTRFLKIPLKIST